MESFSPMLMIILLALTVVSFIPQLQRILSRRDCSSLAPSYLIINLLVATKHLIFYLHILLDGHDGEQSMVGSPPSMGDCINLAQFCIVAVYHLALFALYLYYPPCRSKPYMGSIYAAILLVAVAPIGILELTFPPNIDSTGYDYPFIFFDLRHGNVLRYIMHPITTCAAVCALGTQVRELRNSQEVGALSTNALVLQAGTFVLVGVGWALRLKVSPDEQWWLIWYSEWYFLVGWASVESFIFAAVQGTLWWIAEKHFAEKHFAEGAADGEVTPLILNQA